MKQIYDNLTYKHIQKLAFKRGIMQNLPRQEIIQLLPEYNQLYQLTYFELQELCKFYNIDKSSKDEMYKSIKTMNLH